MLRKLRKHHLMISNSDSETPAHPTFGELELMEAV